ncbi:effector-associated domain EAD1-containing protein [Streptomyces sp. NPDC005407]|uniref:effector-associated domain EAD1-containing protein n=1 Tax=Streptomyces sp. NPDC005407 TaxID=3155340 RepID=UPI0033B274D1
MSALLDERVFPFDDPRARSLLTALTTVYGNKHTALQLALSNSMRKADTDWDDKMLDVWPRVLEEATRQRRLCRLVENAARDPNAAKWPVFGYLLSEEASAPEADPCAAHLISCRQRAFFNRGALRTLLQQTVNSQGNRVLAVRGERRTGRTYIWYLIQHVLASRGVDYCRIQMSKYVEPVEVADVANHLSDQFREWNGTVDRNSSQDSQALSLVNQITGLERPIRPLAVVPEATELTTARPGNRLWSVGNGGIGLSRPERGPLGLSTPTEVRPGTPWTLTVTGASSGAYCRVREAETGRSVAGPALWSEDAEQGTLTAEVTLWYPGIYEVVVSSGSQSVTGLVVAVDLADEE